MSSAMRASRFGSRSSSSAARCSSAVSARPAGVSFVAFSFASCSSSSLQKQLAEVPLHHLLFDAQLHRRHRHVRRPAGAPSTARSCRCGRRPPRASTRRVHTQALRAACSSTSRALATGDRRDAPSARRLPTTSHVQRRWPRRHPRCAAPRRRDQRLKGDGARCAEARGLSRNADGTSLACAAGGGGSVFGIFLDHDTVRIRHDRRRRPHHRHRATRAFAHPHRVAHHQLESLRRLATFLRRTRSHPSPSETAPGSTRCLRP